MIRAGTLRHVVTVLRPSPNTGARGQQQGKDETIMPNWPCSITPTGGSESDLAGGTFADATYQVQGYGDPSKPFLPKDYLLFGKRRLDISSIIDVNMNGEVLELSCAERIGEGESG